MQIDAHHHFWHYSPAQYGWINDSMAILQRDFMPGDLQKELVSAGIDGVVSVQARQSVEETRWLLELAAQNDFIKGVVGWMPLIAGNLQAELEKFSGNAKFKSIRHVLQDEPEDSYMLRADFNQGIRLLRKFNLAYDILIYERHLPQTIEFVEQHPDQIFILNHIAKPQIKNRILAPWNALMKDLAHRPNVYCKLSGVVTEADHAKWELDDIAPYLNVALEAFGPRRLMFGSDWPVCLLAANYGQWIKLIGDFIAPLSTAEQARIMGGTAVEAYRL
jgi:L-fuconolactonase